jgi:hypothetical protein
MTKPDTFILGGCAYSWLQICAMRRQQLEEWKAAQPRQMTLFELKHDCRPANERSARDRYAHTSMLDLMR